MKTRLIAALVFLVSLPAFAQNYTPTKYVAWLTSSDGGNTFQPNDNVLGGSPNYTPTEYAAILCQSAAGQPYQLCTAGSSGTVTSVGLALPASVFTVSGSPVTSSGTLTGAFATQTANTFFAGPTSGSAATPAFRAMVSADLPSNTLTNNIVSVTFGGGSVPSTGNKFYTQLAYAGTITGWTMLTDQSCSAQITVSKGSYSSFPTLTSIDASAPPAISSAQKGTSTTLTGWTTSFSAGDVFGFNLDSVATCTWISLTLQTVRN